MHTGTVKWFVWRTGLGVIADDDGTESMLSKKQILDYDRFEGDGQRVSFDVVTQENKRIAVRVRPL